MALQTIHLQQKGLFAGQTGTIDANDCVIKGVSLITCGCEAEGHNLQVDDETVGKLFQLAKERGKVPVNLDHGTGIEKMNGFVTNFRMDGDKLRGDWHLLKNHSETPLMLERASTMPDCFGLSVAFKGQGVEVAPGKKAARAERLLSVDCVTRPAANADGLFGARDENPVDTNLQGMAGNTNQNQQGEPSIADVLNAINGLNQRLDAHEQAISDLHEQGADQDGITPEDLQALNHASDEELAQIGLTRGDVNAAIDQFNSQFDGEGEGEGEVGGEEGDGNYAGSYGEAAGAEGSAGAGAGAAASASAGGAAFSALRSEVIQLRSMIQSQRAKEQQVAEDIQFGEVQSKITALAAQRDQAIELAERLVNENEALTIALNTGTRPVAAGVENGVRLFSANDKGELHAFQQLVKEIRDTQKCSEAKAIHFAMKEPNGAALHADWLQSQGRRVIRMQS